MVNSTVATQALVAPFLAIEAKNKGRIEMHLVLGIQPELSRDGAGKEPNDGFWAKRKNLQLRET